MEQYQLFKVISMHVEKQCSSPLGNKVDLIPLACRDGQQLNRLPLIVPYIVSHQPYGLYAISNLRKPRVLRRLCSLEAYCTVSSLLSEITCIYKRNRLLKIPSKLSNQNCNYRPLKFVQIRFLSPAHFFFIQLFLHNLILIPVIIP